MKHSNHEMHKQMLISGVGGAIMVGGILAIKGYDASMLIGGISGVLMVIMTWVDFHT